MYKRIQTPNSPLMPLTPMVSNGKTDIKKSFLSPMDANLRCRLRRSFTPIGGSGKFLLSPQSISPIEGLSSKKNSIEKTELNQCSTPPVQVDCASIAKSSKASMKKLRSSARFAHFILFVVVIFLYFLSSF